MEFVFKRIVFFLKKKPSLYALIKLMFRKYELWHYYPFKLLSFSSLTGSLQPVRLELYLAYTHFAEPWPLKSFLTMLC